MLTELGDSGLTEAKERLKLAALFQFTYFGAPMVYYGDEGALNSPSLFNGSNGPEDDPYNRVPYPWADETGDPNVYGPIDNGVKSFYSQLAHLRKQHQALRTGTFDTLLAGDTTASNTDDNSYAFARTGAGGETFRPEGGETAIVVLNNGGSSNDAVVPVSSYFGNFAILQDALGGATYTVISGSVSLTLPARSGVVLFLCAAPSSLTYSSHPALYAQNSSIAPNTPSNGGGAAFSYSIEPALPAGLNFDSGVITGTPTVSSPQTNYTVTASSACGSTMTTLTITVSGPTAARAAVSGQVTTADGTALAGVTISLEGSTSATTISDSNGRYRFVNLAAGSFYTVTPTLSNHHFVPASRSFSLQGNQTDAAFTAAPDALIVANAIDTPEYFVRQQYLDFLGREPDQGGFNYWSEQITRCHGDESCIRARRIDVSAAFFVEREFQDTGSFIYRLYKAALGRTLRYDEFSIDRQRVVGGTNLETDKAAFVAAFVQREEFANKYSEALTAESFVDALLQTLQENTDLSGDRDRLIAAYHRGQTLRESRALVLRQVVENDHFTRAVYDRAFVLFEYFGYLRRDPDRAGYEFWLEVLDTGAPGNYRGMVCSFLTSAEYQRRFGAVVTRSNAECGQ